MNKVFLKFFKKESFDEICTGMFSDILDKMDYKNQVLTNWEINKNGNKVFGKVSNLSIETISIDNENISQGLNYLASLGEGDILFVDGSMKFAYFGELMSRLSIEKKLSGIIINGLTRDSHFTMNSNLPIFSKGYSPKDIKGRGRVKEFEKDIIIDKTTIKHGDFVFGDSDSIVVIPHLIHDKVFKEVNILINKEIKIKKLILKGVSIENILKETDEF